MFEFTQLNAATMTFSKIVNHLEASLDECDTAKTNRMTYLDPTLSCASPAILRLLRRHSASCPEIVTHGESEVRARKRAPDSLQLNTQQLLATMTKAAAESASKETNWPANRLFSSARSRIHLDRPLDDSGSDGGGGTVTNTRV